MAIFFVINTAARALLASKVRTFLAVLGIVIGIASIIIVFSAGEGIRGLVLAQVESFGTDIIETELKVPSAKKGTAADAQSGAAIAQGVQITTLTLGDMEDINKLPNVKRGYGAILGQETASYGNELHQAFLLGASPSYIDIDKGKVMEGYFFTEADNKSLAQVAVLGSEIKKKLFGDSDPIGQSVKIHRSKFKVIGIMEERGASFGLNFDDYIYIPVRTLQKKVMGINHIFMRNRCTLILDTQDFFQIF